LQTEATDQCRDDRQGNQRNQRRETFAHDSGEQTQNGDDTQNGEHAEILSSFLTGRRRNELLLFSASIETGVSFVN
jgi:hypothetical protein